MIFHHTVNNTNSSTFDKGRSSSWRSSSSNTFRDSQHRTTLQIEQRQCGAMRWQADDAKERDTEEGTER
jgi:hypothetical protein